MGKGRAVYASESLLSGSVYLGTLVDFQKEGYKLYRTIHGQEPYAMMRMEWEVEVPSGDNQVTNATVSKENLSLDASEGAKDDHVVIDDGSLG